MTEEYHHDEQGRARIILPSQGKGKIVQFKTKNPEDWFFIGGVAMHAYLLKNTLEKLGLDYKNTRNGPFFEGENYQLINAGKTMREGNKIFIGGYSQDYIKDVMYFDMKHLDKVIPHIPKEIKFIYDDDLI